MFAYSFHFILSFLDRALFLLSIVFIFSRNTTAFSFPFACVLMRERYCGQREKKHGLFLCFVDRDLSIILGDDQLDTQLFYFTILFLLLSSTCFEHYMLIIRKLNFIDAASGIVTLSK